MAARIPLFLRYPWYNSRKAIESWKKAAELGSGESMFDMGLFLFNGRKDMEANPVTGKIWLERAVVAGQKDAELFLQLLDHKKPHNSGFFGDIKNGKN